MNWIRKNAALAVGVGLPLLLMVLFALASWLPKLFAEPPKYDAVFITHYYGGNNGFDFTVDADQHAHFTYRGPNYGNWPKIFRYSPVTGAVQEIHITVPESLPKQTYQYPLPPEAQNNVVPVPIPELEALKLSNSSIAPDGYEFGYNNSRGGVGLMGELFFSPRYRQSAVLHKGGYIVKIPNTDTDYYSYHDAKLVGWVIP